ncbi:MAG: hypothetical protein GF383_03485 [Candidatus Lokiarchaeota archaeon]|nr:hypothetical protein [Candidatus Lokiarchaeota archaeon]MBD3338708.1 hypothetical protein [Candidatus Lokiarchaeota archaeon]
MSKWEKLDQEINNLIKLSSYPVALKLLEDPAEMKNITFLKKPKEKIALCQMFSYSRYYGWTMGCVSEDNICPLADISLGFEKSHKLFEEGAFFVGRYNKTKEGAKKTTSSMPKIPYGKYKAIVSGALHRVTFEPNLILIWGNSAQMMRIIQGYLWNRGGRVFMSTFCDGVCADTISHTILTQDLQIAFPCLGDRRFGMAKDTDLIASIPFGMISEIIEGMESTHKAGTRYPIPYQLSTPDFFVKLKKQLDKATKDMS